MAIDFGTAFGMLTKVVELGKIVARRQLGSMYVNWRGSVAALLVNTRAPVQCVGTERRGADVVCNAYHLGNTLIVLTLQSQTQDGKCSLQDYCSVSIRFLFMS